MNFLQDYNQFPCDLDYWYKNPLGVIKAWKPCGGTVFVVFDGSTNPLRESSSVRSLQGIPNATRAWDHGDVYIISNEVQFREYSDGAIIFFPISSVAPSTSPLGRPATVV